MSLEIVPYTKEMEKEVKDFNYRLFSKGIQIKFPDCHIPKWLPKIERRKIYQEYFLAVEDNKTVRGGYILKHQDFYINGKIISIGDFQLPLSEGIIDRNYNLVGVFLYYHALNQEPLLYGLGMGSYNEPIAKFLKNASWSFHKIPFYFKILNSSNFFTNISYLRNSNLKRTLLNFVYFTGVGYMSIKLLNLITSKRPKNLDVLVTQIEEFDTWVDNLWQKNCDNFSLIAVRDAETLQILYPKEDKKFIRLKIAKINKVIGWVVLLCTQMSGHKQFGNMKVGSIVDCFSEKGKELEIVRAATSYLQKLKVDIIVSNQAYPAWGKALLTAGFLSGPSNFLFATSKDLTELLEPYVENVNKIHLTRGDGDGPINL